MSTHLINENKLPIVIAINISAGGVPKIPIDSARVTKNGIEGDGHAHVKHIKPTRALSLIDEEIIETLRQEGYPVYPGALGENITVRNLSVQSLMPGVRLSFSGGVVIELSEIRKPCFVLGPIHPALEKETVGRIGYMALVITEGIMKVGETICILERS
jgi:MOSC domain-containing protein YiiM